MKTLSIRFPEMHHAALQMRAESAGVPVSTYLRSLVVNLVLREMESTTSAPLAGDSSQLRELAESIAAMREEVAELRQLHVADDGEEDRADDGQASSTTGGAGVYRPTPEPTSAPSAANQSVSVERAPTRRVGSHLERLMQQAQQMKAHTNNEPRGSQP